MATTKTKKKVARKNAKPKTATKKASNTSKRPPTPKVSALPAAFPTAQNPIPGYTGDTPTPPEAQGMANPSTGIEQTGMEPEQMASFVLQNSVAMTDATQRLAAFVGASLFGGPQNQPLIPALLQNQIMLGQQLAGILNGQYVKLEEYQKVATNYNALLNTYNQLKAAYDQLRTENQQFMGALNGRAATQTVMM